MYSFIAASEISIKSYMYNIFLVEDGFVILLYTDVCNQHRTVRERDMQEKKKNTKSGFSILAYK